MTGSTTRVFKELVKSCWLWFETLSQFRWTDEALALSPSSFFISLNRNLHYCLKREGEVFPAVWSTFHASRITHHASRITHHLYHALWTGYSNLINGLIAAASGPIVCWRPSILLTSSYIMQRERVLLSSNTRHYIALHRITSHHYITYTCRTKSHNL